MGVGAAALGKTLRISQFPLRVSGVGGTATPRLLSPAFCSEEPGRAWRAERATLGPGAPRGSSPDRPACWNRGRPGAPWEWGTPGPPHSWGGTARIPPVAGLPSRAGIWAPATLTPKEASQQREGGKTHVRWADGRLRCWDPGAPLRRLRLSVRGRLLPRPVIGSSLVLGRSWQGPETPVWPEGLQSRRPLPPAPASPQIRAAAPSWPCRRRKPRGGAAVSGIPGSAQGTRHRRQPQRQGLPPCGIPRGRSWAWGPRLAARTPVSCTLHAPQSSLGLSTPSGEALGS